jgi:O-antigen ligase
MNLQLIVPLLYPAAWLAFLLSMSRPQIGVYYLTFVLPLQTLRYQVQEYPLGAQLVDIVLLGILIGVWANRRELEFSRFSIRGILLLVTTFSYLSLWHGSFFLGWGWPISFADPRFAVWRGWTELSVMCAFSFAAIKTRKQIETVLVVMCVTALLLSWDFFHTMSYRDVSHYSWDLRYAGVLGYANANGFAAFEAMFILVLLGLFRGELSPKLKLLIPPTIIACGYGLLFAFSRGAYLGFASGVIALGALRRKSLAFVALACLAGSFLLPSAVSDRITGTYTQGTTSTGKTLDSSATDRVLIWENALEIIATYPMFGTGFDTYEFIHPMGFKDTHNFYLKILLEQGMVGLAVFLVMLWKIFCQGYLLSRNGTDPFLASLGAGFAISIVGAAVINIFGDRWSYLQVDSYLWILLALVVRARVLAENHSSPEEELQKDLPLPPIVRVGPPEPAAIG